MYALYDPPAPAGLADDPDRRGFGSVTVIECDNPEAPSQAIIVEKQPKDGEVFHQVPFALTPGPPINTKPLQDSIADTASLVAAGLPNLPADAVTDMLLRRDPRTAGAAGCPRSGFNRGRHHRSAARPRFVVSRGARAAGHGKTFTRRR